MMHILTYVVLILKSVFQYQKKKSSQIWIVSKVFEQGKGRASSMTFTKWIIWNEKSPSQLRSSSTTTIKMYAQKFWKNMLTFRQMLTTITIVATPSPWQIGFCKNSVSLLSFPPHNVQLSKTLSDVHILIFFFNQNRDLEM